MIVYSPTTLGLMGDTVKCNMDDNVAVELLKTFFIIFTFRHFCLHAVMLHINHRHFLAELKAKRGEDITGQYTASLI